MLRNIWVETSCFGRGDNVSQTEKDLLWLIEAVVQRSMSWLKEHPEAPHLYQSPVVYSRPQQYLGDIKEVQILKKYLGGNANKSDVKKALDKINSVMGSEHFIDFSVLLDIGSIDCDGLTIARVAELRQRGGIAARPFMTKRKRLDGGTTYHALCLWPPLPPYLSFNSSEDVSIILGMGGKARAADREKEIQKNIERCDILRKIKNDQATGLTSSSESNLDDALNEILGLRQVNQAAALNDLNKILNVKP